MDERGAATAYSCGTAARVLRQACTVAAGMRRVGGLTLRASSSHRSERVRASSFRRRSSSRSPAYRSLHKDDLSLVQTSLRRQRANRYDFLFHLFLTKIITHTYSETRTKL